MRHIRTNIWGNTKGYEGRKKVMDFGVDEHAAQLWVEGKPAMAPERTFEPLPGHVQFGFVRFWNVSSDGRVTTVFKKGSGPEGMIPSDKTLHYLILAIARGKAKETTGRIYLK